jgi:hypothetical protein
MYRSREMSPCEPLKSGDELPDKVYKELRAPGAAAGVKVASDGRWRAGAAAGVNVASAVSFSPATGRAALRHVDLRQPAERPADTGHQTRAAKPAERPAAAGPG